MSVSGQRRHANRKAIEKYLLNRDMIMRSTCGSQVDARGDHRGGSTPPIPDKGFEFIELNRHVVWIIDMAIKWLRSEDFACYMRINALSGFNTTGDPGLLRKWKMDTSGAGDVELSFYNSAVSKMETYLENLFGEKLVLRVIMPNKRDLIEVATPYEAAGKEKTWTAEDTYVILNDELQEIIAELECNLKEGMEEFRRRRKIHKRSDVSIATLKRARGFCKGLIEESA